jgi:hypothetical protein
VISQRRVKWKIKEVIGIARPSVRNLVDTGFFTPDVWAGAPTSPDVNEKSPISKSIYERL